MGEAMNPYKKLVNNSIIFAIGNFGSKIINFILVPLYTYYLTTEEYGVADLITVTISLLLPIISANVFEASLRFAIDSTEDQSKVLNNSIFIGIIGSFVTVLSFPLFQLFFEDKRLTMFMILILILQMFRTIFSQFTRGMGEVKTFAVNGVLLTFSTAAFNILLLTVFEMGLEGYLLSIALAYLVSIIHLGYKLRVFSHINLRGFDQTYIRLMLKYSIPMIPNNIMWWLINASNRYFILNYIGTSANGIYAISARIPGLISIVSTIFMQAWQLSAIEEYENEGKSEFYTTVFNTYSSLLYLFSGAIMVIIKPLIMNFFNASYYESWENVPLLLLGVVFSCLSSFLAANYLASKETRGAFKTSIVSGIASIIFNLIFIPTFGLLGAGLSNMLSFLIMFLVRYFDTKKYVEIQINWIKLILNTSIIFLQMFVQFMGLTLINEMIIITLLFFVQLLVNRQFIIEIMIRLINLVKSKI